MTSENGLLKISHQTIYQMLVSVYPDLYQEELEEQTDFLEQLDGLFAELLMNGIAKQVKRGLYKGYVRCEEPLTIIRGKIDIHRSIKLKTQVSRQLYCEYDEFDKDNLYNQILKSTCLYLMRQGRIKQEKRKKIKDLLGSLYEVSEVPLRSITWENIRFHKDKFAYRSLIGLCYMIYKGLREDEVSGQTYLNEMVMGDLYERFIQSFYKTECPDLSLSYQGKYNQGQDHASHLKNRLTVDMLLTYGTHRLIVNTHYFEHLLEESKHGESKDFLMEQVRRLIGTIQRNPFNKQGTVSGMILYPSIENHYLERYELEGGDVYLSAINLTLPFEEMKDRLLEIGEIVRDLHQRLYKS